MGMVKVYKRMERWCRVNKVVDEGMEWMVENEKRWRMVQDEMIVRMIYI